MAPARLLFLVRLRNWLMSGGMMTRRACGKVTCRSVSICDRPRERAASVWPRPTDWMPARTISAMNEEVYITSPTSSTRRPAEAVNPPPMRPNLPSGAGMDTTKGACPLVAMMIIHAAAPPAIATPHPYMTG